MFKTAKILLIASQSVVAEGVRAVLLKRSGFSIAGHARTLFDGAEISQTLRPDVVIADMHLPRSSDVEAIEKMHLSLPDIRIIMLSENFTALCVRDASNAGITGFVEKETAVDDLPKAVDSVLSGEQYFSLKVRQAVASDIQQIVRGKKAFHRSGLTGEEVEMVRMLTEGDSIGQIAIKVKKSPKTIDAKRRKIMSKLGFESIANLTKYAIRHGITSLEA